MLDHDLIGHGLGSPVVDDYSREKSGGEPIGRDIRGSNETEAAGGWGLLDAPREPFLKQPGVTG
jgi:hypothetical protein